MKSIQNLKEEGEGEIFERIAKKTYKYTYTSVYRHIVPQKRQIYV